MPKAPIDPLIRLMSKVVKEPEGCWVWTGSSPRNGYSYVDLRPGKFAYGHRLSYERHVGPIPEGHRIHHVCEVRRCVNPGHLVPVTAKEHAQEHGSGLSTCTVCGANDWYKRPNGQRWCNACRRKRRSLRVHPCAICGQSARATAKTCSPRCGALLRASKPRPVPPHGTTARYGTGKCRCEACRGANTAAARERAERQRSDP